MHTMTLKELREIVNSFDSMYDNEQVVINTMLNKEGDLLHVTHVERFDEYHTTYINVVVEQ